MSGNGEPQWIFHLIARWPTFPDCSLFLTVIFSNCVVYVTFCSLKSVQSYLYDTFKNRLVDQDKKWISHNTRIISVLKKLGMNRILWISFLRLLYENKLYRQVMVNLWRYYSIWMVFFSYTFILYSSHVTYSSCPWVKSVKYLHYSKTLHQKVQAGRKEKG